MQQKLFVLLVALCSQLAAANFVLQGFDDVRMASSIPVPQKINALIDEIFGSIDNDATLNKAKALKAAIPLSGKPKVDIWRQQSIDAYEIKEDAEVSLSAYRKLLGKDRTTALSYGTYQMTVPYPYCPNIQINCTGSYKTYRTETGACNNLNEDRLWWGETLSPYKRLLPSRYDDYVSSPRTRSVVPGASLPHPRSLAIKLFASQKSVSEWTQFFNFFGQFVDHDIAMSEQASFADGYRKLCPCGTYDPDCFNIAIPPEDHVNYGGASCMPFVRSSPSLNSFNCALGPREQINLETSWLDLSGLYGWNEPLEKAIRSWSSGLLLSQEGPCGTIFPALPNVTCDYQTNARDYSRIQRCFATGDSRAVDNVFLAGVTTIFLREHNRIAAKLQELNPSGTDQAIWSEARRILTGVYQNIVYGEFLPALIGRELSEQYRLLPREFGYVKDYNDTVYPQVINEVATAAFRYGHTVVSASHRLVDSKYYPMADKPVRHFLFNNQEYATSVDDVLRGTLMDWSYAPDSQITSDLNDWLFQGLFYGSAKQFSLGALNIQRGRDHGLQPYNKYRKLCGLRQAYSFDEFDNMPEYTVNQLRELYASPDDVDLFVGLFSEYPVPGGILGATASCLVAKQFRDLKFGDRFYFENDLADTKFSLEQLQSIRSVTVSRLLCDNLDIDFVQKYAFFVANKDWNPLTLCKDIPELNLNLWASRDYGDYIAPPTIS